MNMKGIPMKEKILNLLQYDNISFEKLQRQLSIEPEELNSVINELTQERLIFLNTDYKYELIKQNYLIGRLEKTSKDANYVKVGKHRLLIPSNKLHTALKNDLVIVEPTYESCGVIKGILERKNNRLVCEVKQHHNRLVLVPFNGNCEIHLITPPELLTDYIIGDRVYVTLTNESSKDNDVTVRQITKIGHFNDEFNDELAIAISKDFDIDFSKEAMEEAKAISQTVLESEKEGRVDLTNETIFTIDSIQTKDMDDAISIKKLNNGNYELGVHIADVAHYIKPGSTLFKEAAKRGTSVYLGDVVIPMLPSILSNGICSLNEGVERLTKSCIMEIDEKGNVVNYKVVDSIIKSKKKMTYEDLNEIFKGNGVSESYLPFIKDIFYARELANILRKKRKRKGQLDFESSDINVVKDIYDNERILDFENRSSEDAEKLIENFMILANEVIATDFYWRDLPFIYRTHSTPQEDRLDETLEQLKELGLGKQLTRFQNAYGTQALQKILDAYKDSPLYSVVSNLILRSMAKAKYTTENYGHYALALESYTHFTSPIRRFPDLMVHTLINRFNGKNARYNKLEQLQVELTEIANHSSYKERQADDAEKDYIKLKMAEYMAEHQEEEFEGIILDIDKDKVFIRLDNNIKCLLDSCCDFALSFDIDPYYKVLTCRYSKQKVTLGTRILVKASQVDIPQKTIYVDIKAILKLQKNSNTRKLELK